mgnify:FL=1
MSQTTIPSVLLALREQLTAALPNTIVSLGPTLLNEPGTALYIGVVDMEAPGYTNAVTFAQSWPLATHSGPLSREEEFRVNCAVEAYDGEGDLDAALAAVGDVFEQVSAHVRESRNLGVQGVLWVNPSEDPGTLDFAQHQGGASALLLFALNIHARL